MRILVIEKEPTLYQIISNKLEEFQYQTDIAENMKDGIYFLGIRHYDLVITNYFLNDGSTLELIPIIKSLSPKASIIVISPEYKKEFEIQALKNGADDFLAQPFDFDIFFARINARLRFKGSRSIRIKDLLITPKEERVIFREKEVDIKGKPFEVLTHLAIHRNQIVSKEELLDSIWEEPELVTPNVIEVAINQIRQKIDKPFHVKMIETIRRKGYRFCYPKNK